MPHGPMDSRRASVLLPAFLVAAAAAAAATIAGCGDRTIAPQPTALDSIAGLVVSRPMSPAISASGGSTALETAASNVVYVSLAAGSVPDGRIATIQRKHDVASLQRAIVDGGFDPVAVAASLGDTVVVNVTRDNGLQPLYAEMVVVRNKPLTIVRTRPPSHGTDVPLNIVIAIVFSEPVDSGTVQRAVLLSGDGTPVAGTVAFADTMRTVAEFRPAEALKPATSYELSIADTVQAISGARLPPSVTITFTTQSAPPGPLVFSSGIIEITTTTTGIDLDPTGYLVQVDNGTALTTTVNGVYDVTASGGSHTIAVSDIASNCTLDGSSTRTLNVTVGRATRDTARTTFAVTCIHTDKIAFSRDNGEGNPDVMVAYADGTNAVRVGAGLAPSWSPDGARLAVWACDIQCGRSVGIATMRGDGSDVVLITNDQDTDPAWSPDGSTLVFVRQSVGTTHLYKVQVGSVSSSPTRLPIDSSVRAVAAPAWSPDGSKIAFRCDLTSGSDICVVNADGSGLRRLTADSWFDDSPVWSPDGTRIAFATNSGDPTGATMFIAIMNSDGSNVVRLTPGRHPTWSPDGKRIAFVSLGVWVMNAGATGFTPITSDGSDLAPAWRP